MGVVLARATCSAEVYQRVITAYSNSVQPLLHRDCRSQLKCRIEHHVHCWMTVTRIDAYQWRDMPHRPRDRAWSIHRCPEGVHRTHDQQLPRSRYHEDLSCIEPPLPQLQNPQMGPLDATIFRIPGRDGNTPVRIMIKC